jgi:hypothetical protein
MADPRPSDIVKAIDSEMLARATGGVSSYTIAGRSFTKTAISELMTIRRAYADLAAVQAGFGVTYADLSRESVEVEA